MKQRSARRRAGPLQRAGENRRGSHASGQLESAPGNLHPSPGPGTLTREALPCRGLLEAAITHPERVGGLVLACTAPGWPFAYPMPRASVRLLATTAVMTTDTATRRYTENALSARTVRHHPELVGRLVEFQRSRPKHPSDRRVLRAQAAAGTLYVGRLRHARIQTPTLVLHGSADTVVDPRNANLIADRIPGARLVIFPGLGHLLFWEDPDGFADAVTSFLLAADPGRNPPPAAVAGTGSGRRRLLAGRGLTS